jgi:hypothetical protein
LRADHGLSSSERWLFVYIHRRRSEVRAGRRLLRRESGRSSQGKLKRPDEASDTVTKARAGTPPEGDEVGVDDFTDDERDFGEEQGGSEGMQDDAERMGERRSDGGGEGDMGDQSQDAMDERGQGGEYERSDEYDESDEYDR